MSTAMKISNMGTSLLSNVECGRFTDLGEFFVGTSANSAKKCTFCKHKFA